MTSSPCSRNSLADLGFLIISFAICGLRLAPDKNSLPSLTMVFKASLPQLIAFSPCLPTQLRASLPKSKPFLPCLPSHSKAFPPCLPTHLRASPPHLPTCVLLSHLP